MSKKRGLYIHIPFCKSKCSYCDFHSAAADCHRVDSYLSAVIKEMEKYKGEELDTLYIGGGTPSLLGASRLEKLLNSIHKNFILSGEATMEANPADDLYEVFSAAAGGGINRISMGVQSAVASELEILGRRHTVEAAEKAVLDCRRAGINNISLDLMLGIPKQTPQSLKESIDFLVSLAPTHISAYILKLEEGTPLFLKRHSVGLPDEDTTASLYLQSAEALEKAGYFQYEISNFSKKGCEARHNLKYWRCEEYIGIGASAHGFYRGKRYFYPPDTDAFIEQPTRVPDGEGGGDEERFMLGLRLKEGVNLADFPALDIQKKIDLYKKHGLCELENNRLSLTKKGFLVSNEIIAEFLS